MAVPRDSNDAHEPLGVSLLRHAVLLLFVFISVYPVLIVLSISLRPGNQLQSTELAIIPENWTIASYRTLFENSEFATWLVNSLIVSGIVTVTGVALASLGGYALSRYKFVGRQALMLSILTTQMFPATMLLLPLYILIAKLQLVDTYLGLMVFYVSTALPFCIWQMKGFYDTIPPSLEEAARIDGCSQFAAFWRIVLPVAVPGLVITALFSFMTAWSEYIVAAQVLQSRDLFTLPLGIKSFQASMSTQWGLYAAASILVSVPVVVVFIVLSRYLVSGMTLGAVKE